MRQKMDNQKAKDIIEFNRHIVYKPPAAFTYLRHYIYRRENPYLRDTLLAIYRFIDNLNALIIYRNKYCFFLDNKHLTYKVRKRAGGEGS